MAGIRNRTVELKNRLSEYVRMVRSGAHVQVTVIGPVVAELVSPGRPPIASSIQAWRRSVAGAFSGSEP